MNAWMFTLILKTMPRTEASKFEDSQIIIKPRKAWKNDIFKYSAMLVVSLLCFFLLTFVPYLGPVFFIAGALGAIFSLMFDLRAILVYKNYYELFTKEQIAKLDENYVS